MTQLIHQLSGPLLKAPLVASGGINLDLDLSALVHMVLFFGFVFFMKPLIFDPLLRVFEERERRTAGAIDKARAMDEEALTLKKEADAQLDDARREASTDRDANRTKLAKLQNEATTSTRDAVAKTLDKGMGKVSAEVAGIKRDLDKERATLASEIASRVLGREVKSS
jgi:F-type H+-transporting ATPase subunit b